MKAYQQPARNEHNEAALYKLIVDLIRFGSFCLHKGFCRFYHLSFFRRETNLIKEARSSFSNLGVDFFEKCHTPIKKSSN